MQPTDSDVDLEWLIHQGPSAMGESGTLAGVTNQLERGGPSDGARLGEDGSYIHPLTDQQLGTGKVVRGDVERHRWLSAAWFACSEESRGWLLLRHMAPRAAFRSDEGFGATDRHVEGSDGKTGRHGSTRTGVEAHLGELASVALIAYEKPGELLIACHEFNGDAEAASKPNSTVTGKQAAYGRTIRRARKAAEKAMEPAWAEWFESKEGADPMRLDRERRAVLPPLPIKYRWTSETT